MCYAFVLRNAFSNQLKHPFRDFGRRYSSLFNHRIHHPLSRSLGIVEAANSSPFIARPAWRSAWGSYLSLGRVHDMETRELVGKPCILTTLRYTEMAKPISPPYICYLTPLFCYLVPLQRYAIYLNNPSLLV